MNNASTPEQAHDEQMLTLMGELSAANFKLAQVQSWIRSYGKPRPVKGACWGDDFRTWTEALADFDGKEAAARSWEKDTPVLYRKRLAEATVAQANALAAYLEHEANYTGWQRYFLVTSSAGLVHRSMNCSSCNKGRQDTTFALLPSCSGRSHEALVEALGPSLCSICWPDAPVAWTDEQRLSPAVTNVLLTEGEAAFWTALADSRAKAVKRAATKAAKDAALAARKAARLAAQS